MHAHCIARAGLEEDAPERRAHFLEYAVGILTILNPLSHRVFSWGLSFPICKMGSLVRSALCALSTGTFGPLSWNWRCHEKEAETGACSVSPWGATSDNPCGVAALSSSPAPSGQHVTCPSLSLDLSPSQS